MYRFLLSKRYANLLSIIGKTRNLHSLSKEADMTISHLSNVTDQWEREGIIKKVRVGREVDLETTEKGNKIIELLRKFDEISEEKSKEKQKEVE